MKMMLEAAAIRSNKAQNHRGRVLVRRTCVVNNLVQKSPDVAFPLQIHPTACTSEVCAFIMSLTDPCQQIL